jgi:HSP20 family protein
MFFRKWTDVDKTLFALEDFRRRMHRAFAEAEQDPYAGPESWTGAVWPRANLYDNGSEFVVELEIPGLSEKEIDISATQESITIAGERKAAAPEGYLVHRQERVGARFSRSFPLPCHIDVEKVGARVRNGVLTVSMAKAAEARPRQITVKGE